MYDSTNVPFLAVCPKEDGKWEILNLKIVWNIRFLTGFYDKNLWWSWSKGYVICTNGYEVLVQNGVPPGANMAVGLWTLNVYIW